MDRALLLAVAIAVFAAAPEARADRLGGNYRGPDDACVVREDAPAPEKDRGRDPLLASLGLDRPFLAGLEAGRREALYRGRPLLVFYVLPGCDLAASVARGPFRDAEVLRLLERTVPVAVDAEREELFGVSRGVRTLPTILLLDADGAEVGRAEGAADADRVAAVLREGLRRARPARPAPEAVALEKAAGALARARRAKDWSAVLRAAAAVEAFEHEGPEREAARAALGDAALEAASRLEEAEVLLRDGRGTDARRLLGRVAREFEGLPEAARADALLRGQEGTRPAGGGLRGYFRTIGTGNARVPASTPSLQREAPPTVSVPGQVLLPEPEKVPPPVEDPDQRPEPEPVPEPDP